MGWPGSASADPLTMHMIHNTLATCGFGSFLLHPLDLRSASRSADALFGFTIFFDILPCRSTAFYAASNSVSPSALSFSGTGQHLTQYPG